MRDSAIGTAVGTKSFLRCAGFSTVECLSCGEWWSIDPEDLPIATCDCGGTTKTTPPGELNADAREEWKLAFRGKIEPYILKMKVRPSSQYTAKKMKEFSEAISTVLVENGEKPIAVERKFKFVVGTLTLPGMATSKAANKPIERYWPLESTPKKYFDMGLKIDLKWYKNNLQEYICSAFGFDSLDAGVQRDMSRWF